MLTAQQWCWCFSSSRSAISFTVSHLNVRSSSYGNIFLSCRLGSFWWRGVTKVYGCFIFLTFSGSTAWLSGTAAKSLNPKADESSSRGSATGTPMRLWHVFVTAWRLYGLFIQSHSCSSSWVRTPLTCIDLDKTDSMVVKQLKGRLSAGRGKRIARTWICLLVCVDFWFFFSCDVSGYLSLTWVGSERKHEGELSDRNVHSLNKLCWMKIFSNVSHNVSSYLLVGSCVLNKMR